MLDALRDAGWQNYSLFLRPDGLLVGYLEAEDLSLAQAAMARTEVNDRWQREMAEFFSGLADEAPDQGFELLDEIFNLDDQLARIENSGRIENSDRVENSGRMENSTVESRDQR